ncbi:hypothetical protein [Streptomyces sp. NPDC003006]
MRPLHPPVLSGEEVYRMRWVLGTDRLLGHPEGHHPGPATESAPASAPPPRHAVFA